jgi:hypothetical protein
MFSFSCPQNTVSSDMDICTTASVFEKANSIRFELLFGNYIRKSKLDNDEDRLINAFEYIFRPGQIFGFAYESTGQDYQKFHHAFVLQACAPLERGAIVTGIQPGARIIISATRNTLALRLKSIIKKLQENKIDLTQLSVTEFQRIHRLLEVKINPQFAIGELLAHHSSR